MGPKISFGKKKSIAILGYCTNIMYLILSGHMSRYEYASLKLTL